MKIAIITNCSKSKKQKATQGLMATNLKPGSLEQVSSEWSNKVNEFTSKNLTAKDQYVGRSFKEVKKIGEVQRFDWYIISAGLGLIPSEKKIPSYDLTITNGSSNSIVQKLTCDSGISDWWQKVNEVFEKGSFPIAELINKNKDTLFLIALTKSYFNMISTEFSEIHDKSNIRLFGYRDSNNLHSSIKKLFLPYSSSFDGPDSENIGIKNDFPRRVMRHYVEQVIGQLNEPDFEKESKNVDEYLSKKAPPKILNNKKFEDDYIIEKIKIFNRGDYPSHRQLLKHFRHELGIACEESRFKKLFREVFMSPIHNITNEDTHLIVRALRTNQKTGIDTYSFFLPGSKLIDIANISRIKKDVDENLKGFQRKEIKNHVNGIVEYLDEGDVLFPNAIILALDPDTQFKQARGTKPEGDESVADAGTLFIPYGTQENKKAWVVDGQQRTLALSRTTNSDIPVPVVGFISPDIDVQRQQFIIVNKAKPLPSRLINELLPEVSITLPRDLKLRKLPSELCNMLNSDTKSPFYNIIKRMSDEGKTAVITDSSIELMIQKSLRPLGILNQFKGIGNEQNDYESMYEILTLYWTQVKNVFPEAWGLIPQKSRLMHNAGIRAMGLLMDQILMRVESFPDRENQIFEILTKIKPYCRWTGGTWEGLGWKWNEVQSTPSHINKLSEYLCRIERELRKTK